jgi:hypothetical protein
MDVMLPSIAVALVAAIPAADPGRPAGLATDLAPPVHVTVGDKPVDVQRSGHAAPCVGDFDGDGKPDLLVGQYDRGMLRVYRNTGTGRTPKLEDFRWFEAGGAAGRVPEG